MRIESSRMLHPDPSNQPCGLLHSAIACGHLSYCAFLGARNASEPAGCYCLLADCSNLEDVCQPFETLLEPQCSQRNLPHASLGLCSIKLPTIIEDNASWALAVFDRGPPMSLAVREADAATELSVPTWSRWARTRREGRKNPSFFG